jgi:hypothetical protein
LAGIDVEICLNQGTLFIIDAQLGYHSVDIHGNWKLAMSLLSRAKKEVEEELAGLVTLAHFSVLRKLKSYCSMNYGVHKNMRTL